MATSSRRSAPGGDTLRLGRNGNFLCVIIVTRIQGALNLFRGYDWSSRPALATDLPLV
jgi:hypothetical protein